MPASVYDCGWITWTYNVITLSELFRPALTSLRTALPGAEPAPKVFEVRCGE